MPKQPGRPTNIGMGVKPVGTKKNFQPDTLVYIVLSCLISTSRIVALIVAIALSTELLDF